MEFKKDRDSWVSWASSKDESAMQQYRIENNATSLDGLDALQAAQGAASSSGKSAAGVAAVGKSGASSCCMVGLLQKVVGEAAAGPVMWLSVGLVAGVVLGVHAARR
jgi:hypothetical protein